MPRALALWRRAALGAAGLALCLLLTSRAHADDVTWRVSVGFSNAAKQGAWTPIFVDVTNEGESQTGRIIVPMRVSVAGYAPRFTDYMLPVDLPRHAKKRYALYVPLAQAGGPDVVFLDLSRFRAKQENPGGQNMRSARSGDLLIVVVGGDSGFLNFLSGKRGLGVTVTRDQNPNQRYNPGNFGASESETQVGRLEWTGLPDSWLGWDGVDAVVLGDAAFSGLSTAALEALRTWVQLGGTLIVPGGSLAPAVGASSIADLLPADITGTTTLPDLSVLATWAGAPAEQQPVLISQLALRRDAEVLCGTVSQPLIVSRPVGSGRVVMTAFDFTAAPLKYWGGQEAMWSNLLIGAARPISRVTPREWADPWGGPFQGIVGAASTMPEAELPSMALIVSFLLAYIVVLVPLNYTILNRLDRRELAWLTTPVIVAIFTFGAYGLGYAMRGGTIVLNRLGVVEAAAGSPIGRGHGYLGLFSPARTSYEIDLRAPASGARDLVQSEQRVGGRLTVTAGAEQRIQNASMNMWTTRAFGVEYTLDLQKGITGDLEYDGKTITGRVRNGTRLSLRNCRLIVGGRWGKAVNLAAGQEKEVSYSEKTARSVTGNPYFHNPQSATRPELEEIALAAIFPGQGGGPGGWYPGGPSQLAGAAPLPVFAATTGGADVPATLARRKPQVKDTTILLVDLPIHLARGQSMAVPGWLISSRVIGAEGNFNYNPYGGGFEIIQGSVTTEFGLPTAGRTAVANSLDVMVNVSNPSGPSAVPAKVLAYDFTNHRWESVLQASGGPGAPGGWGRGGGGMGGGGAPAMVPASLPHPQDFLSPSGTVRVKVATQSGAVRVDYLGLTAKVTVR